MSELDSPVQTHPTHLTVAAVARRIGVAPGTLRTWGRRYGVGPTDHSEGRHRRYSEADVGRLVYMRKLIISGVAPIDAATAALAHDGRTEFESKQILSVESDLELVDQLHRAAWGLDRELVEEGLLAHINKYSIEESWHSVIVPLLVRVGDEWKRTGEGIEVEHLLSDSILRILHARISTIGEKVNARPVLIASIGEETHSLAITALAAVLSERGIAIHILGARTPQGAINEVVRRTAPPAIFLWAQLRKNADSKYISGLPSMRPKPVVIVGGPGWNSRKLTGAHLASDLMTACSNIERAVGL